MLDNKRNQLAISCFKFTQLLFLGPSGESDHQEHDSILSSIESGIYSTILLVTGSCKVTANLKTVLTIIEIAEQVTERKLNLLAAIWSHYMALQDILQLGRLPTTALNQLCLSCQFFNCFFKTAKVGCF